MSERGLPAGFVVCQDAQDRALRGERVLRVRMPRRIRGRAELFAALAERLRFPAYFGDNWDALEECLGDLSWLAAEEVVIEHPRLPCSPGSPHRAMYLDVLRQAMQRSRASQGPKLWASIPRSQAESLGCESV